MTTAKAPVFTVVSMGDTYRKRAEVDHGGGDHIYIYAELTSAGLAGSCFRDQPIFPTGWQF